jgi:hypothetical protein
MSSLLFVVYLGLIPLILVAGVVMAVRSRHRLGTRASNQLLAGAGLLLLAHILTALRPLVFKVIQLQGGFSGVVDVINGLSLLQLVAQAGGFALIIVAVFTAARAFSATSIIRSARGDGVPSGE